MFESEKQKAQCLKYIDQIHAASKVLYERFHFCGTGRAGDRPFIMMLLRRDGNFNSQHNHGGMYTRNIMRQSEIFPPEETLPEHFYDSIWTFALLDALRITKEEFDNLHIEDLLTNKDEATRHVGWCLEHLYGAKYA